MMKLGAFSISLAVKDIHASLTFYSKLGFEPFHGDTAQGWLILRNADGVVVGLFQGMFTGNLLTFNPGWNSAAQNVDPFDDVREIQRRIEAQGLTLATRIDAGTSGPASLTLADPDGNVILIDQHR